MPNLKRTAEIAQLDCSTAKKPKILQEDFKTEPIDDYPDYPTLAQLDPEYGLKIILWELRLIHNSMMVALGKQPLDLKPIKVEREWYQFEFGKISE